MKVLLLRLGGPMQSWGTKSRFPTRRTDSQPSKSGIIGLLAAAEGRRRCDSIEDLLGLRIGVRTDQPGIPMKDFQVSRSLDEKKVMPLSNRYYLADAVFLAGISGEPELIDGLAEAVRKPKYPLYLGRRSCVPTYPILLEVKEGNLLEELKSHEWLAAPWFQKKQPPGNFETEIAIDADVASIDEKTLIRSVQDVPISFDSTHRQYGWREVAHIPCGIPTGQKPIMTSHNPGGLFQ